MLLQIGYFRKKSRQGGWGQRISSSTEEKGSGNSRGQLGVFSCETHVKLSKVLVLYIRICKGYHKILQNFQAWEFVFSGIFKDKLTNLKIPERFFRKVYLQPPLFGFFSGITQFHSIVYVLLCHKIMLFVILQGTSKNIHPVLIYWWNSL